MVFIVRSVHLAEHLRLNPAHKSRLEHIRHCRTLYSGPKRLSPIFL